MALGRRLHARRRPQVDEDGGFRIDHVPEGTWTLREHSWGRMIGPRMEVIVEKGRLYPVDFHVRR